MAGEVRVYAVDQTLLIERTVYVKARSPEKARDAARYVAIGRQPLAMYGMLFESAPRRIDGIRAEEGLAKLRQVVKGPES